MPCGSERALLKPGQESVWDYPRPPRIEPAGATIAVRFAGIKIAKTSDAMRVLETSHPPVFYIPPADIRLDLLAAQPGTSYCEFKGEASYISIGANGRTSLKAGWLYRNPSAGYESIAGFVAFYASRVDEAWVGEERVRPQEGDFYGGWITSAIVGPFKGGPATSGW